MRYLIFLFVILISSVSLFGQTNEDTIHPETRASLEELRDARRALDKALEVQENCLNDCKRFATVTDSMISRDSVIKLKGRTTAYVHTSAFLTDEITKRKNKFHKQNTATNEILLHDKSLTASDKKFLFEASVEYLSRIEETILKQQTEYDEISVLSSNLSQLEFDKYEEEKKVEAKNKGSNTPLNIEAGN